MDRLLLTCPSRSRPDRIVDMIRSFYDTKSEGTDLFIVLDDDDPRLSEYIKVLHGYKYEIRKRDFVAQIHNYIAAVNPCYKYYMPINDDIIFRTKGWDELLIETIEEKGNGWGISYGNDMCGNVNFQLPTFGCISGNIVKTLGYLYPLELNALFGDTYLLDLGRAIGKLFYNENVIIEHVRKLDYENDYRTSKSFEDRDRKAYAKYIDHKLDSDVHSIFNAIVASKYEKEYA